MAKKNNSYFTEERMRNNNPNFYVNMREQDLRRQVKRIIKDIKFGNITEPDLLYFTQDNIISACINECYENVSINNTMRNALIYYYNNSLGMNSGMDNETLYNERVNVSNILTAINNKCNVWSMAFYTFNDISINKLTDPELIKAALSNIARLDKSLFYDL